MVYKKYVWINGKKYGPYLYHNKRVGQKIVTSYHGRHSRRQVDVGNYSKALFALLLFAGVVGLFYAVGQNYDSFLFSPEVDHLTIDLENAVVGELISGTSFVRLRAGELLPQGSGVLVRSGDSENVRDLIDLVDLETTSGEFYITGSSLSGSGQGYGLIGSREVYPDVSFELEIVTNVDDELDVVAPSGGGSGAGEGVVDGGSVPPTRPQDGGSGDNEDVVKESESNADEGSEDVGPPARPQDSGKVSGDSSSGESDSRSDSSGGEDASSSSDDGGSDSSGSSSSSGDSGSSSGGSSGGESSGGDSGGSSSSGGESGGSNGDSSDGGSGGGDSGGGDGGSSSSSGGGDSGSSSGSSSDSGGGDSGGGEVSLSPEVSIVSGSVNAQENLVYSLDEGQNVKVVLGSVMVNGEVVDEGLIEVVVNGEAVVSTEYFEVEEGFGEEFLGDEVLEFDFDLDEFGFVAEEGEFVVELVYENDSLASDSAIVGENILIEDNRTENRTLRNESILNETVGNETDNRTSDRIAYGVTLGEPVEWVKKVDVSEFDQTTVVISVPESAENVEVRKDSPVEKTEKVREVIDEAFEKVDVGDILLAPGDSKEIDVSLDGGEETVEVVYTTPAPYAVEEQVENGKKVTIVGPEDVEYREVGAFSDVSEFGSERLRIYWVEEERFVPIDRVENNVLYWTVEHLSNQTYLILIEITSAEHLDSNREFISDIYAEVSELDGNWSEVIPAGDYVRVVFEQNLTSERDITVFPRTVSGTPRIEIYEMNGSEIVAQFGSLNDNELNTVYLDGSSGTGLGSGEQDVFDLLILDGDVEFDWIVDPTQGFSGCGTLSTAGDTYSLDNNIEVPGSPADCIVIGADNIVLEGNGYTINGTGQVGFSAIEASGRNNITIRNITLINSGRGVRLVNTNDSLVEYVQIVNNSVEGIQLNGAYRTTVRDSFSAMNQENGISLFGSGNNFVHDNLFQNNSLEGVYVYGESHNNTFVNNSIVNSSENGIRIQDSSNNSFFGGEINLSGSRGIYIQGASGPNLYSNGNLFEDIAIQDTSGTGRDVVVADLRTDDNIFSDIDIGSFIISNARVIIRNTSSGQIHFLEDVDENSFSALSQSLFLEQGLAGVDSDVFDGFNVSANITFYNSPGFPGAVILRDGLPCGSICSNFTALDAENVSFNVSYWSNYTVGSQFQLSSCQTLGVPGVYTLEVDVFSDDTCFVIGSDNVTLDGQGNTITYSETAAGVGYAIDNVGGYDNVTIMNAIIEQGVSDTLAYGIRFDNSMNSSIFNNSISTIGINSYGILFTNVDSSFIDSNVINVTGGTAIGISLFLGSDSNVVARNNVSSLDGAGLNFASTSISNTVLDNFIESFGSDSISISSSSSLLNITGNVLYADDPGADGISLSNSNSHHIFFNNMTVLGSASRGVRFSQSQNSEIFGNRIVTEGVGDSYAVELVANSDSNVFTSNSFNSTQVATVRFLSSGVNYPEGNEFVSNTFVDNGLEQLLFSSASINGTRLIDQEILNYSFAGLGGIIIVENSNFGEIRFLEMVNGSGSNFSSDIRIRNNSVSVGSDTNAGLNRSANISLYGIGERGFPNPDILRDGLSCGNVCSNFTSLNASTVVFNVTSWTNYSIGDSGTPLTILNSPANESVFVRGIFNITLNSTVYDNENDLIDVFVYGIHVNSSGLLEEHGLLYQDFGVSNGSDILYNWTASPVVPDANSVLLLHFDNRSEYGENATYVFDFATGLNNGTLENNTFINSSGGRFGGAAVFDGAEDTINLGDNGVVEGIESFSVSVWARTPKVISNSDYMVAQFGAGNSVFRLEWDNTEEVRFVVRNESQDEMFSSTSGGAFGDSGWHHVVGVYDQGEVRVYYDGVRGDVRHLEGLTGSSTHPIVVGSRSSIVDREWTGSIDEVAIWNRSLSDSEVQNLYKLGVGNHSWKVAVVDSNGNSGESEERQLEVVGNIFELNECGALDLADGAYTLQQDVTSKGGDCFTVSENNISFFGQNYVVHGLGADRGIFVSSSDDFSLYDVSVRDFATGLSLEGSGSSVFDSSFFENIGAGVSLSGVSTENNSFFDVRSYDNSGEGVLISSGKNETFVNLFSHNNSIGLRVSASSFNTFSGGLLNSSRGNALEFSGTSVDNVFDGVAIAGTDTGFYDLIFGPARKDGNLFIDMNSIGNYSLGSAGGSITIRDSTFGEIDFLSPINGSGTNFSRDIRIEGNLAVVESEINSGLNRSANVSLYGTPGSGLSIPRILRNGEVCSDCFNFTSLLDATVVFNVSGWTNYSISGNEGGPTIIDISDIGTQSIAIGAEQIVNFSVIVEDLGGFSTIDFVSAAFAFADSASYDGVRTGRCSFVGNLDAVQANYSCEVGVWYFDKAGIWNVSVSANDSDGLVSDYYNETFDLLEVSAINLSVGSLSWSGGSGDSDILADSSVVVNNLGNANISSGNVQVLAFDLLGEDNQSHLIPAMNFSVGLSSGGACSSGDVLQNNTEIVASSAILPSGNTSLNNLDETSGQEELFFCLREIPFSLENQNYVADLANSWQINAYVT